MLSEGRAGISCSEAVELALCLVSKCAEADSGRVRYRMRRTVGFQGSELLSLLRLLSASSPLLAGSGTKSLPASLSVLGTLQILLSLQLRGTFAAETFSPEL